MVIAIEYIIIAIEYRTIHCKTGTTEFQSLRVFLDIVPYMLLSHIDVELSLILEYLVCE
jgi:hypothetical protein